MEQRETRGDGEPQATDGSDTNAPAPEDRRARSDRPASARPYWVDDDTDEDADADADAKDGVDAEKRAIKDLGDDEIVQISVKLRGAEVKALQGVADRYGTNLTEAMRRCIATQHWMDHQRSGGASLYLEGPGRRRRRVVFR